MIIRDIENKSVVEKRKVAEKPPKQFNHLTYEKIATLLKDVVVLYWTYDTENYLQLYV